MKDSESLCPGLWPTLQTKSNANSATVPFLTLNLSTSALEHVAWYDSTWYRRGENVSIDMTGPSPILLPRKWALLTSTTLTWPWISMYNKRLLWIVREADGRLTTVHQYLSKEHHGGQDHSHQGMWGPTKSFCTYQPWRITVGLWIVIQHFPNLVSLRTLL